ncbi:ROK family protein [bacterium]|nr:ROK family protein [bacterium]
MTKHLIGLEIGGTKLQIGGGDADGTVRWLLRRTIEPAKGADGIREQIVEMAAQALSEGKISDGEAHWGVGFGGPVNTKTGAILKSHQIEGWSEFPFADWLKNAVKATSVTIRNDADTAALAEALAGAGRGFDPLAYITIGSGIGGGLVVNGHIYAGSGRGAMEIGHLRVPDPDAPGKLKELELIASGWSIQRRSGMPDVRTVAVAIAQGDIQAGHVVRTAAESVGLALSHVVHLTAPSRIILGGGVSLLPDELWADVVRESLNDNTMEAFRGMTDVVTASLGESVVVVGGILLAVEGSKG